MDFVSIAELGSQIVLDAILLFLVTRYLPKRDADFIERLESHNRIMARLVSHVVKSLPPEQQAQEEEIDKIISDAKRKKED